MFFFVFNLSIGFFAFYVFLFGCYFNILLILSFIIDYFFFPIFDLIRICETFSAKWSLTFIWDLWKIFPDLVLTVTLPLPSPLPV